MQQAVSIQHNGQTLRGMQHIPEGEKVPAVILLHGFTGTKLETHRFFLKISRALEVRGIASFRFDFLGSGESDGNFEEMTVGGELEEASAIFEYVKTHPVVDPSRIIVLGFSMGGLVASLLAGERRDEIHKLILLAPAGAAAELAQFVMSTGFYISEYNAYDMGGNLVGTTFITELKTIDVWNRAAQFPNEVLLIHGMNDEAVPVDVSSLFIQRCYHDKATLHTVKGADHTFNSYEWEQDVIAAICKFI